MSDTSHQARTGTGSDPDADRLERERGELLVRVDRALDMPMTVLGFVWLLLTVVELTRGLSPLLEGLNYVIWAAFILQFLVEFTIAPRKVAYLRGNWLTAVALLLPALRLVRVLRVVRAMRAVRGARLVRLVSSVNRGMRTLGRVLGRRGVGYVAALTLLVNVLGAAGILAFESGVEGSRVTGFGSALWWTAMTLTTMGADFFPVTPEGRVLALLLALYGFAIFGYVTAALASVFVARDAEGDDGELAGAAELRALRTEIAELNRRLDAVLRADRR